MHLVRCRLLLELANPRLEKSEGSRSILGCCLLDHLLMVNLRLVPCRGGWPLAQVQLRRCRRGLLVRACSLPISLVRCRLDAPRIRVLVSTHDVKQTGDRISPPTNKSCGADLSSSNCTPIICRPFVLFAPLVFIFAAVSTPELVEGTQRGGKLWGYNCYCLEQHRNG
jgi:hypothetical protein